MSRAQSEGREWLLIGLDAKVAARQGMPFRVPVPKSDFEGLAEAGLAPDRLRGWIKEFLEESPLGKDGNWRRRESVLVSQLEGFVDKAPLWQKAQRSFEAGDFEGALKTLRRITIMCPDDHAARMNYASALANQGQFDKALKELKQIRETFAGEPDFHVTYAQMLVMRGNEDGAVTELLTALEAKPDHMGAMDALAKLGVLVRIYENPRDATSLTFVRSDRVLEYLEEQVWSDAEGKGGADYFVEQMGYHQSERRHDVAIAAADRAIAAAGGDCEKAELGKIASLRELGRTDEAIATAQAVAERTGSAAAYVELALSLQSAGNEQQARAAVQQALAADPGDSMALALALWPADRESLRDVQAALPGIQQWADEHPEVSGAWRSLARAKLVVGDADGALELFRKAVDLAPADDDLRSEWWAELAKLQRYQEIVDDAQALGDMATRDWKLRWNEAEAYAGLGRTMEARACYMQINTDEGLHVDIRKRAKRAANELGAAEATTA